jgi:glutathione-specific gamma-glutamylcyclotransferase
MDVWLFGYGSLIWRPDFDFRERRPARVRGWVRRFWQGSHDHRGLPHAPGRVVTLVPQPGAVCDGVAYRIASGVAERCFAYLDHREKNGYARHEVSLEFHDGAAAAGLVYVATGGNHAFLGEAPLESMVAQIAVSHGPSGTNADYLLQLAAALRGLGVEDPHVFELERGLAARLDGAPAHRDRGS